MNTVVIRMKMKDGGWLVEGTTQIGREVIAQVWTAGSKKDAKQEAAQMKRDLLARGFVLVVVA